MRLPTRITRILPVLVILLLSCSDGGGPTDPVSEDVTVTIQVRRTDKLAEKARLGADRGKATLEDATTGAKLGTATVSIDTTAAVWTIPVSLPRESAGNTAVPVIELINLSSRPEWSGKGKDFEPEKGDPPPVEVFPGPPENLEVTGVTITSGAPTILEGDSVGLEATVEGGEGTAVVWSSLDEELASVDRESGMVRGVFPGVTSVEAAAGEHADTLRVTVEARVAAVEVTPGADTLGVIGDTLRFSARALDARDNQIDGVEFTWSSSDATVAEVDGTGLATARAFGAARITASAEGVEGGADLAVEEPILPEGVTRQWVGGAVDDPTAWGVADNWYPSGVPTEADTVLVGAEAVNQPVLGGDYSVGGLIVEAGATVDLGTWDLNAVSSVEVVGTMVGSGWLVMRGRAVTVAGGVPNLRIGANLTGGGRFVSLGGDVAVAGRLEVIQNDTLMVGAQTLSIGGDLYSEGAFLMDDPASVVTVQGRVSNGANAGFYMTAGRMEVAGDMALGGGQFDASGTHLTVLNGDAPQGIAQGSFQELRIANTSDSIIIQGGSAQFVRVRGDVEISTPVRVTGPGYLFVHGDVSSVTGSELVLASLSLGGPAGTELIDGFLGPAWLEMRGTNQTLTGGANRSYTDVSIRGSVTLGGDVDVAGSMHVIQNDNLIVGPNTLSVGGNLFSEGDFLMDDPASVVTVQGSISAGSNRGFYMTAGRMEVAGDLNLIYGFYEASGTHLTVLNGTGPQTIDFRGGLQDLQIANTDPSNGVSFSNSVSASGNLSHLSGIWNVQAGYTTTIQGNLTLESEVILNNDGTVQYGGTFTDNGATINGNSPGPIP